MLRITSIILAIVLLFVFAGFVTLRWLRTSELHRGGAHVSPEQNFLATIEGVYYEDFWGYKKEFYEFKIYPKKKIYPDGTNYEWVDKPIAEISILNPRGKDLLMYRGTPPFPSRWSSDSSRLEIDFFGSTITLYTRKKAEQGAAANP